jgi:hypothetical protein
MWAHGWALTRAQAKASLKVLAWARVLALEWGRGRAREKEPKKAEKWAVARAPMWAMEMGAARMHVLAAV